MLELRPPRSAGLAVGLAGLAAAAALCAGALAGLAGASAGALQALSGVLSAAAAAALGWLAYRLAGLAGARYRLTAEGLAVQWWPRRVAIARAEIEEARLAQAFPGQLEPPAWNWPGCYTGRLQHPELGAVEFLATTRDKAGLVMLGYADGWLVISPPDPAAFLEALAASPDQLPPAAPPTDERLPALAAVAGWALWRDRLAVGLLAGGAAPLAALAGYLLAVVPGLPALIALRFGPDGQPTRYGPPAGLFMLVLIGAIAWAANAALGAALHAREAERPAAYLLFGAAIVVQVMLWVAAAGLLTAGAG